MRFISSATQYSHNKIYTDHDGQTCTIIREMKPPEIDLECAPMFIIKFSDGTEIEAFGDELIEDSQS